MNVIKYGVSAKNVNDAMLQFAKFTSGNGSGVTRLGFSREENSAAQFFRRQLSSYGATPRADFAGNMFGTVGQNNKPAIMSGSHLDSVVGGGKYDGVVGVVAAMEAMRIFAQNGARLTHPFTAVGWRSEESASFGVPYVGARLAVGNADLDLLAKKRKGRALADYLRARHRLNNAEHSRILQLIEKSKLLREQLAAYVEVHIEQGPLLQDKGAQVAAVSSISGNYRFDLVIGGESGHSGAVPASYREGLGMNADRIDAQIATKLYELGESLNTESDKQNHVEISVTSSILKTDSSGRTVIPGHITRQFDVRSNDCGKLAAFMKKAKRIVAKTIKANKLQITLNPVCPSKPIEAQFSLAGPMHEIILESMKELSIQPLSIPSGAGHDAKIIAELGVPTGMIFVRSPNSQSHNPKEFSDIADIVLATELLVETIVRADRIF